MTVTMVKSPVIKVGEESKKRKKVSKKTKKAWRKHVNTDDVDSYLEDKRLVERLGKPFDERSDAELFVVDTKADEKLINVVDSKAAKRLALRNSELKYCSSLKSHTAVPDPITKRNHVKTPEQRKNPITKRIEKTRKDNGQLTLKEKNALKNRGLAELKKQNRYKRGDFSTNVWSDDTKNTQLSTDKSIDCDWFESDTLRHIKPVKKSIRVKTSAINKVAAVEPPHPGISYNPSFDDHQQLLHQIAQKEIALIKEEKHLDRVTTHMFKKVTPQEKEKNWLEESSQGLPVSKGGIKSESEEDDHPGEVRSINPPAKLKKKTKQQRRKQMEQKKLAFQLKNAKIEKKKVGDMYKLKKLKTQIDKKEVKDEVARKVREKNEEKKASEPGTLSKTKFEPPEMDFKLGQDLSGNLRNADPTGNLLRDRYKSLQQRSIVAPSTRVLKLNKPKVKKFIKDDHKITWTENKQK